MGQHLFQIYLTPELEEAFYKYKGEQYGKNTRVDTLIFRRALQEFLENRRYLSKSITHSRSTVHGKK